MITSHLCKFSDYGTEWYRDRLVDLKEGIKLHRKQWEFAVISQVLLENGVVHEGNIGVGYAVGEEPLPSLFASWGAKVIASDQAPTETAKLNWGNGQLCDSKAMLNRKGLCHPKMFEELVEFRHVDMNFIPEDLGPYDFCWSSCSFEHLGNIDKGLEFVVNSSKLLKPGGVGVHTTEYNVSSNNATLTEGGSVYFRKRDIERLGPMLEAIGCEMLPVDWSTGNHPIDSFVDEARPEDPPFHLKLMLDGFVLTSIAVIVKKKVK
jgi:SAM-dependent methyltransferase